VLRVGIVKTASGARAVQVICYLDHKRIIYKHIGPGKTHAEAPFLMTPRTEFCQLIAMPEQKPLTIDTLGKAWAYFKADLVIVEMWRRRF
jgi:hypothetical protein